MPKWGFMSVRLNKMKNATLGVNATEEDQEFMKMIDDMKVTTTAMKSVVALSNRVAAIQNQLLQATKNLSVAMQAVEEENQFGEYCRDFGTRMLEEEEEIMNTDEKAAFGSYLKNELVEKEFQELHDQKQEYKIAKGNRDNAIRKKEKADTKAADKPEDGELKTKAAEREQQRQLAEEAYQGIKAKVAATVSAINVKKHDVIPNSMREVEKRRLEALVARNTKSSERPMPEPYEPAAPSKVEQAKAAMSDAGDKAKEKLTDIGAAASGVVGSLWASKGVNKADDQKEGDQKEGEAETAAEDDATAPVVDALLEDLPGGSAPAGPTPPTMPPASAPADDPKLPAGWQSAVDPGSGNTYYISPANETQWDPPNGD